MSPLARCLEMARLTTAGAAAVAAAPVAGRPDGVAYLADEIDDGVGDDPGGVDDLVTGGVQGDGEAAAVGAGAGGGEGASAIAVRRAW